jgi:PhzF family phenazine biosynthesis protein
VRRRFAQIDVFPTLPLLGNPVAVVLDAEGLDDDAMQRFASWTNLSEATFLVPPVDPAADYRVRIFTPVTELPFAGHPTLGTAHAWLETGGRPQRDDVVVQECAAGLIPIRRDDRRLAFAAPPRVRTGPAAEDLAERIAASLDVDRHDLHAVEWVDNGPGWVAALLSSADAVLSVSPRFVDLDLGLVGFHPAGSSEALEVRAFFPKHGVLVEDPVTGSLNASLAQWLLESGRIAAPYVARQGTALGRAGHVHVDQDADAAVWVGGATVTCVEGTVDL